MAKKRRNRGDGESIGGYFRKIFSENPALLYSKSNEELKNRWLHDHPGYTEIPKNVVSNLANVKSILRKRSRKKGRSKVAAGGNGGPSRGGKSLAALEELIDDCMTLAKNVDREGLHEVIRHLRYARNQVVWKSGQP